MSAQPREVDMDVRDIMTRNPFSIEPESPLGTAIAVMVERKIRHLPVIDERGAVAPLSSRQRSSRTSPRPLDVGCAASSALSRIFE
jgi:CBS domain-containing protein